jgi:hypothetical protein
LKKKFKDRPCNQGALKSVFKVKYYLTSNYQNLG